MLNDHSYYVPDHNLEPPEDNGRDIDDSTTIELYIDDDVQVDGTTWNFVNETFAEDEYYDEVYNLYLDDKEGVEDKCLDLLDEYVPTVPGTYHVKAVISLAYDIEAKVYEDYEGNDEDGYPVTETEVSEFSETSYNKEKSTIEDVVVGDRI